MQKLALIMAALMMLVTRAVTEDADHTIIGGADGPTAIYLKKTSEPAFGSITLSFDANITTGYEWKASVVGGDSVEIDMDGSGYRADPSADPLACGTGGRCVFKLNARSPVRAFSVSHTAGHGRMSPYRSSTCLLLSRMTC